MLIDKADAAYPGKFTFTMNDNEILKKTVPEGQGWAIENQAEKPDAGHLVVVHQDPVNLKNQKEKNQHTHIDVN